MLPPAKGLSSRGAVKQQCSTTEVQSSGSQTVRRDAQRRCGITPGEAAKTEKTEEKQLKIPVFFVRSAVVAIESNYR
jgi:hypothetical protein